MRHVQRLGYLPFGVPLPPKPHQYLVALGFGRTLSEEEFRCRERADMPALTDLLDRGAFGLGKLRDPAGTPADQPRPGSPGGDLPQGPLDDLEGPSPPWALTATQGARETYRRYEWSRPGALLHVDVARLARFNRPGHALTGVRDLTGAEKRAGVGYVYLRCVIDDRSRYAYVEQHRDQSPLNAFRDQLAAHGARHILTPPYTPRWNGKVERFIQTLKREWAYAHSWPDSVEHTRALAYMQRFGHFGQKCRNRHDRFEYSDSAGLAKAPATASPARNPPVATRMTRPEVAQRPGNAVRRS